MLPERRCSVILNVKNLLDDEMVLWRQLYPDFKDGMHGATGGLPRDESVMEFLSDPRIAGVRTSWRFGN